MRLPPGRSTPGLWHTAQLDAREHLASTLDLAGSSCGRVRRPLAPAWAMPETNPVKASTCAARQVDSGRLVAALPGRRCASESRNLQTQFARTRLERKLAQSGHAGFPAKSAGAAIFLARHAAPDRQCIV